MHAEETDFSLRNHNDGSSASTLWLDTGDVRKAPDAKRSPICTVSNICREDFLADPNRMDPKSSCDCIKER